MIDCLFPFIGAVCVPAVCLYIFRDYGNDWALLNLLIEPVTDINNHIQKDDILDEYEEYDMFNNKGKYPIEYTSTILDDPPNEDTSTINDTLENSAIIKRKTRSRRMS